MLRISKLTDYGVLLTTWLAEQNRLVSVKELSEHTRIPIPTVSKILKQLAHKHVLESQRGPRGGYLLSRPAEEICVTEVIEALEGPIAITECANHNVIGDCEYEENCELRCNWQRINDAIRQALDGISLADMVRTSKESLIHLSRSHGEADQARIQP